RPDPADTRLRGAAADCFARGQVRQRLDLPCAAARPGAGGQEEPPRQRAPADPEPDPADVHEGRQRDGDAQPRRVRVRGRAAFAHLKLKDPFKGLVSVPVADTSSTAATDAAAATAKPAETPKQPKQPKQTTKPAVEPAASGMVSFSAAAPPPNAAIVKTNGRR